MKKLSSVNDSIFFTTSKEQILNRVCSDTGLDRLAINQLYENLKVNSGMTDELIIKHFENLAKPKGIITADDFHSSLISVLNTGSVDEDKKGDFTEKFLQLLNDNSDNTKQNYIDSVNLISIVKDILTIKNPEAKKVLSSIQSTSNLIDADFSNLNESLNMLVPTDNVGNTVKLYEGLKIILSKNSKRWGHAYHLDNAYNRILEYINQEIDKIQLNNSIVSYDDKYHMIIINDFMTNNVNPIYKDFGSVKTMIGDSQTLVFDMILLINNFMVNKEYDLQFVSKTTYENYRKSAQAVLAMINSSCLNSKILADDFKLRLRKDRNSQSNIIENEKFNSNELESWPNQYQDVLQYYSNNVDSRKLETSNYNIGLKSVVDMLNFIKSASFEFNLSIRPVLRMYINQAYELTSKVEKARILRKNANL